MRVESIAIGPSEALEPVESVRAVAGKGLEGDRHFTPDGAGPGRAITLIEAEVLEDVGLTGAQSRRQVVVSGVRLNDLIGKRFSRRRGRVPGRRALRAVPAPAVADAAGDHRRARPPRRAERRLLNDGTISVGDAVELDPGAA